MTPTAHTSRAAARLLLREPSQFAVTGSSSSRSRCYASTSKTGNAQIDSRLAAFPASSTSANLASMSSSSLSGASSLSTSPARFITSSSLPSGSRLQSTSATASTSSLKGTPASQPAAPALRPGLLGSVAKLMGYDARTSAAIRTTSDYYDRCSERDEKEGTFWYDECGLPESYQSWMQVTNLHIWLLSVRFRSLPAPLGRTYIQEIVNHYFIHAESLMRGRYNIRQNRLIKGYMRDMLYQYHGANMGYDEGLVSGSDAVLAAAIWRNLFGAGWGRMGGVKGKLNQDGREINTKTSSEAVAEAAEGESPLLEIDPAEPPSAAPAVNVGNQAGGYHSGGSGLVPPLPLHEPDVLQGIESKEARFAVNLERLAKWIRSEVKRMENIPDEVVMNGGGIDRSKGESLPGSLTYFSRI